MIAAQICMKRDDASETVRPTTLGMTMPQQIAQKFSANRIVPCGTGLLGKVVKQFEHFKSHATCRIPK